MICFFPFRNCFLFDDRLIYDLRSIFARLLDQNILITTDYLFLTEFRLRRSSNYFNLCLFWLCLWLRLFDNYNLSRLLDFLGIWLGNIRLYCANFMYNNLSLLHSPNFYGGSKLIRLWRLILARGSRVSEGRVLFVFRHHIRSIFRRIRWSYFCLRLNFLARIYNYDMLFMGLHLGYGLYFLFWRPYLDNIMILMLPVYILCFLKLFYISPDLLRRFSLFLDLVCR